MSRTYRDIYLAHYKRFWETTDYRLDYNLRLKLQRLAGIPPLRSFGFYNGNAWIRSKNHRRVRHHTKMVCRTRQFRRLYRKDAVLKEWLD